MPRVNIPVDQPAPEGGYIAEVADIEETNTKAGDPMWRMRLLLIAEDGTSYEVIDRVVFSAKAANRLRIIAKAFGLPHEGDVNFEREDLIGKSVQVLVEHDEYDGKLQAKIAFKGYKAIPAGAIKPAPVKAPASDPVRDVFGGKGDPCPKEHEPLPEHDAPPAGLDDIPF